jgi:hypothetical protein
MEARSLIRAGEAGAGKKQSKAHIINMNMRGLNVFAIIFSKRLNLFPKARPVISACKKYKQNSGQKMMLRLFLTTTRARQDRPVCFEYILFPAG